MLMAVSCLSPVIIQHLIDALASASRVLQRPASVRLATKRAPRAALREQSAIHQKPAHGMPPEAALPRSEAAGVAD